MANYATRMKRIESDLIPPIGAEKAGTSPRGDQLYVLGRKRSRAVPRMDKKTGEREWLRNPNGDRYQRANDAQIYDENKLFFLEADGNGYVYEVVYAPPTPKEQAEIERQRKIEAMGGGALAAALVDAGITDPAAAVRLMLQQQLQDLSAPDPVPEDVAPAAKGKKKKGVAAALTTPPTITFPFSHNDGWWTLSTGSRFEGSYEEALEAETAAAEDAALAKEAEVGAF